jgi:hypothetical protein
MDQYRDVIPDDRGEEIRRLVRERDGVNTEGRPTKRARAETIIFLPPGAPRNRMKSSLNLQDQKMTLGSTIATAWKMG